MTVDAEQGPRDVAPDGGSFHLELELPGEDTAPLLVAELSAADARAVADVVATLQADVSDRDPTPETLRDRLEAADEGAVVRRRGRDCTFYYRLVDGRPVERAVFDDGRVGGVYEVQGVLANYDADAGDVLDAAAWPTPDDRDDVDGADEANADTEAGP